MWISHRCAVVIVLFVGCGASPRPSSEAPATDRSGPSEAVAPHESQPPTEGEPAIESEPAIETSEPVPVSGPDPRIYYVDSFAGEAFVLLGTAPSFPRRGARVLRVPDDESLSLAVATDSSAAPSFTVVGTRPCAGTLREPVLLDRRMARDLRSYDDGTTYVAVRVDADCEPALAIEGEVPDARLITFDFEDADFGDPIVGRSTDGWGARIQYAPSDDGICPGAPAVVSITAPDGTTHEATTRAVISGLLVLAAGARVWVVIVDLTTFEIFAFPSGAHVDRTGYPTGIDLAEECI